MIRIHNIIFQYMFEKPTRSTYLDNEVGENDVFLIVCPQLKAAKKVYIIQITAQAVLLFLAVPPHNNELFECIVLVSKLHSSIERKDERSGIVLNFLYIIFAGSKSTFLPVLATRRFKL